MSTSWRRGQEIRRGVASDLYEVIFEGGATGIGEFIRLPGSSDEADSDVRAQIDAFISRQRHLLELNHPNLVKVYDISLYKENTVAVIMEKVNGQSLFELLKTNGPLQEDDIRLFVRQICKALDHLHNLDNNVLHRNITSETVRITEDKTVKLGDYGMTIQLLGASSHRTECQRGLPQYLAPELLKPPGSDGIRYSRESDIWAVGCVVFEMTTGTRPYNDFGNMMTIGHKVEKDGAPKLLKGSPQLRSFYEACVAKERRMRKSATALLEHEFLKPQPLN